MLQNSSAEHLRFFSGGHFQLAKRGQIPLAHSEKIKSFRGSVSSGAKGSFCSGLSSQNTLDALLDKDIRPSGAYALFDSLNNRELWLKCWEQYFKSINYIIDVYGVGKKLRYPSIDSASYEVKSQRYQQMLAEIMADLKIENEKAFYIPSLKFALRLLELNHRDESVRHEPLELNDNRIAIRKINNTEFSKYKYSAIVIPGQGPDKYDLTIALTGKQRCRLGAAKFFEKLAPFIIVSGGYCHPFQTKFAEALEMKKFLIDTLKVPASAIIIDPHARHTTTNFRNAGRFLIWYGFPNKKPAMLVTTLDQANYIANPKFALRNQRELGYLPYRNLKRLSDIEFSFYPVNEVLTRDAIDPLDP